MLVDDCDTLCAIYFWGGLLWMFLGGPLLLFAYVAVLVGVRSVRARLARLLWLKIIAFLILALLLLATVVLPYPYNVLNAASALAGLLVGMLIRMFASFFGERRDRS